MFLIMDDHVLLGRLVNCPCRNVEWRISMCRIVVGYWYEERDSFWAAMVDDVAGDEKISIRTLDGCLVYRHLVAHFENFYF